MDQIHRQQQQSPDQENAALLVPHSFRTAASNVDESALAYPVQSESDALLDLSNFTKDFEVRRDSADHYLDQYLQCLDRIAAASSYDSHVSFTSQDVTIRTEQEVNRDRVRMDISRDTVIRDLHVMDALITSAKATQNSHRHLFSPAAAVWTFACSVSAVTIPVKLAAGLSVVGAVVGAVVLGAPPLYRYMEERNLDDGLARVQNLRHAFEQGNVQITNKDDLKAYQFKFLQ
ncbi:hypothetical protein BKA56DRAFT_574855 [Ilyonectria sp. MPI-CAGE-AT-0026]|nr:hypothetical protein BKA56DRAFT_574855 [Ilyonectria sp. MPI-CAGE-AT-0026]